MTNHYNMDNFFTEFLGPDSLFILFVALGSFLIGFITAWLLWGGEAKRYKREAEQWKKSHDDLLAQYAELKEEMELKDADYVKAQREATEAIAIAKSLEADKDRWQSDLDAALESAVKAQASASSYQTAIEDLNNQIIGLKAMNADLTYAIGNANSDSGDSEATLARLKELEEKVSHLEAANIDLQTQLDQAERVEINTAAAVVAAEEDNTIFAATPDKAEIDKGESVTLSALSARDAVLAAIGTTLPAATEADKDDLTRIKGIGSFLEKKLNALGLYTYEQISRFDADMIEKVTTAIEFFPGRIERDDWVGQAARLMAIKAEAPEALKPSAVLVKNMDDLKTVEGIGPKIEKLLKENGIADLAALAEADEKNLREILFAAGSRYRIHDPTTWPEQAALAVKGDWETLHELQDKLKGGREVD